MRSLAKKRKKKKNNRSILVAIVVLCIIGVVSYFGALKFLGNGGSTKSNKNAPNIKDVAQTSPDDKEKEENKNPDEEKKPSEKPVEETPKETEDEDKKEDEVKEDQPPEETVKPNSAFAEEVVNNFSVLYPITVNSGRSMEVLEQLIIKDSDFYNQTKKQLDNYKKDKVTIQFTDFTLQDVNYVGNQQFDIKISQELVENKAGNSTSKKQSVVYRVISSEAKTGIISAKVN